MDDGLILETTFLIDLEREERRRFPGPAHEFLAAHPSKPLAVSMMTTGEMASGIRTEERDKWLELIGRFALLPIDLDVCWEYGRAYQYLRTNGMLIGTNDLWIAATGLANNLPVVTRNTGEFERVPGLTVLGYSRTNAEPPGAPSSDPSE